MYGPPANWPCLIIEGVSLSIITSVLAIRRDK
jgi:hypothetical protein